MHILGKSTYRRGFALIGLIITLMIIAGLFIMLTNLVLKRPVVDRETEQVLSEQEIDTTSYRSIVDSTKKKYNEIEDQHMKMLESMY